MDARDFWITAYFIALHKAMPTATEMMASLDPEGAPDRAAVMAGIAADSALTRYENRFGENAG